MERQATAIQDDSNKKDTLLSNKIDALESEFKKMMNDKDSVLAADIKSIISRDRRDKKDQKTISEKLKTDLTSLTSKFDTHKAETTRQLNFIQKMNKVSSNSRQPQLTNQKTVEGFSEDKVKQIIKEVVGDKATQKETGSSSQFDKGFKQLRREISQLEIRLNKLPHDTIGKRINQIIEELRLVKEAQSNLIHQASYQTFTQGPTETSFQGKRPMTKVSQHLSKEEYESFIQAQNMNEQYKKVFEK